MSEVTRISKIILQVICQLFWLSALMVGLGGIYLMLNYRQTGLLFQNIAIILPAILALVSAAVLLSAGMIGCWVSIRDSAGLQALFVYLLLIVFCLQATAATLSYVNIGKVHSEFEPFWNKFQKYTGHSQDPDSNAVDAVQEKFQCCGVYNYTDWLDTSWFNRTGAIQVPHSCCNTTFHNCNGTLEQPEFLYLKGCQVKLEDAWIFVLHLIIFSSGAIAAVLIVGLISVAKLMRDEPLQEYQVLDRDMIS
ncbi:tetraspanin 37 [Scleropages formosus]|uniref:Tetraspanin n=1 Tax=Scleropages formosus TaxID=113540 RepID=A0A8C9SRE6_SCLFO|nr:tetraspanin-3-like [Scleropages formosus]